jgi:hypothetical protein
MTRQKGLRGILGLGRAELAAAAGGYIAINACFARCYSVWQRCADAVGGYNPGDLCEIRYEICIENCFIDHPF